LAQFNIQGNIIPKRRKSHSTKDEMAITYDERGTPQMESRAYCLFSLL
jgi:hypothetical protein